MKWANEFCIDTQKMALMGYSAGGHPCACVAQMLHQAGIPLSCQVLCYLFFRFRRVLGYLFFRFRRVLCLLTGLQDLRRRF